MINLYQFKMNNLNVRRSIIYIICAFISIILINYLILFYRLGLGFFLFNTSLVVLFEIARYAGNRQKYFTIFQLLIFPILFFSATFFFRADDFVLTINFIALMVLIPAYVILTTNPGFTKTFSIFELVSTVKILVYAENIITPVIRLLLVKANKEQAKSVAKAISKALLALIITIPIFFIILAILISADTIFKDQVLDAINYFAKNTLNFEELIKFGISSIIAFILWSYLSGLINKADKLKADTSEYVNRIFNDSIIPFIIINSLNIIYFFFVIVQFGYLFGGEAFTHEHGVIFSDYAIKGFWEMITVTLINYCLLYLLQTRFSLKSVYSKILLIPSYTFTVMASIVMVISSYSKIMVYINGYGYTRDRLIPLTFLIFIALILILTLVNSFLKDSLRKPIIKFGTFIIVIVFLMGFSLYNMDNQIVKENLKRSDIDYYYLLYETGLEGKVAIYENLNNISSTDRRFVLDKLKYEVSNKYSYSTKNQKIQELSLPSITLSMEYLMSENQ